MDAERYTWKIGCSIDGRMVTFAANIVDRKRAMVIWRALSEAGFMPTLSGHPQTWSQPPPPTTSTARASYRSNPPTRAKRTSMDARLRLDTMEGET